MAAKVPQRSFTGPARRVALTVVKDSLEAPLSPFFAKAGWIALVDPTGADPQNIRNISWTSGWICELLPRD